MLHGYAGRILHLDLSEGRLEIEEPDEAFYRRYVGGSQIGLYYLIRYAAKGVDPTDAGNVLTFALSGITGAPISGQSRCSAVAKSPLTGGVGDSQAGGYWPAELKFAGFDAIVIRGASPTPVYLWVNDGKAELRDATHLWGKTTTQTEAALFDEIGDARAQIAQVGPAGERMVKFAAIMNMANRANGRNGMGAVMGSKRLKAIAVRGSSRKLSIADPDALRAIMKASLPNVREDPDMSGLSKFGTPADVEVQDYTGGFPTRNWLSGSLGAKRAIALDGTALFNRLLRGASAGTQMKDGRDTCYSCAVRCKRVVESEWSGRRIQPESGGPEYETIAAFGSYCDIDDLEAVAYASQLCNEYGVDTISAGGTMAFAMECFEEGLITAEDTGGIELRWGDAEAMVAMLERTLQREGFGDVLAEGSARAAEIIGNGADRFVMAAKKQELPAHMPHLKASLGLTYAVNPYGAEHQASEHDPFYEPETVSSRPEKYGKRMADMGLANPQSATVLNAEKVRFALRTGYGYNALNTHAVCAFVFGPAYQLMGMAELAEAVTAVTGWQTTVDDLLETGARTLNMQRAFNAREGFTRADDTLPRRLFEHPLEGGATDGRVFDETAFNAAREEYYRQAGWDPVTGNPTRERLAELDLDWVADAVGV